MRIERRRIDIDDQLRTSGWAFVSTQERETLLAAVDAKRSVASARGD